MGLMQQWVDSCYILLAVNSSYAQTKFNCNWRSKWVIRSDYHQMIATWAAGCLRIKWDWATAVLLYKIHFV